MATTRLALGPWLLRFRLTASAGVATRRRGSARSDRLYQSPEELLAEGATDAELICLSHRVGIDDSRREWQTKAGLLGIRP